MSKDDSSNLKFLLGLIMGIGLISTLSPTARQLIKERLAEALENSKPHLVDAIDALMKVLDEAKSAVIDVESDILGAKPANDQGQDEPLGYIV